MKPSHKYQINSEGQSDFHLPWSCHFLYLVALQRQNASNDATLNHTRLSELAYKCGNAGNWVENLRRLNEHANLEAGARRNVRAHTPCMFVRIFHFFLPQFPFDGFFRVLWGNKQAHFTSRLRGRQRYGNLGDSHISRN